MMTRCIQMESGGPRKLSSLLFFPEGQEALRRRAADHAGDADRYLAKRRSGHAAECDSADADLAPEAEIAPAIGALGLEFFHSGQRILAHRPELHVVGGLNHLGERRLDRQRLPRKLATQEFPQARIADRVARQRVA